MKSFAVIGLGRFGTYIATALSELGCEVLAIDRDEKRINQMADVVTRAVTADAQNKDVLKALGVQDCDCAVVAIGQELAAAVLITLNLKEMGVENIICKARDEQYGKVLEKVGATRIVSPEQMVAEKLARSLHSVNVLDYIELSEDYGIIDIPAPSVWVGKTIRELNIRAKLDVNIIAVKHEPKITVSPSADYRIEKEDVMVVLGRYDSLDAVGKL